MIPWDLVIGHWSFSAFLAFAAVCLASCASRPKSEVIVYTSQDQMYAEPIFEAFSRATGIEVRPVFDTESTKTKGLANRLMAESGNPQCDVFWNNEELMTRALEGKDVFRSKNPWVAVGYRSRRLVLNTNLVSAEKAPKSLLELTNSFWRGKVALAYPLFGTTSSHFLGLKNLWGEEKWRAWGRGLVENKAFLVDGNSMVVKLVGKGEAWIGLTDSDDIAAGQREGLPISALPLSEEFLLIPNSIAIVRNAPNPKEADILFEYLQRKTALEKLVAEKALEGFSAGEVTVPTLKMDWPAILAGLDASVATLQNIFLR